jgi:hypothetical protein
MDGALRHQPQPQSWNEIFSYHSLSFLLLVSVSPYCLLRITSLVSSTLRLSHVRGS